MSRRGPSDHPAIVKALSRADTREVAQLLADEGFAGRLAELAASLGRDPAEVSAEAAGYLREMGAMHSERVMGGWSRFTKWMFRAHDLQVDEEAARRLRALDREYSLLFLFSHRSYLDGAAVPLALERHGIDPAFTLGGANLNF